jgi:ribonuclease D
MSTVPDIAPNAAPTPPYQYLTTLAEQEAAVALLRPLSVIGVDTEGASLYRYRDRVSLIQVSGGGYNYLFDPFSGPSPMSEILENRNILKIFHGADYDIVTLKRDLGCRIGPLFDTALAARAIGIPSYSLGSLVLRYFGVTLSKVYQKSDWSQRPLSTAQMAYAACDTAYLIPLYEILTAEVRAKGRNDQMEEECLLLEALTWNDKPFDPNSYLRIQGAAALSDNGQRVLRELVVIRDEMAQRRDVPPFRVIDNDTLLLMARSQPQNEAELAGLFPRKSAVVHRKPALWLSGVQRGLLSSTPLPRPERGVRTPMTMHQRAWFSRLQTWRANQAQREGVEPAMVISTETLREGVRQGAKTEEAMDQILHKWQISRYGAVLVRLAQGELLALPQTQPQGGAGEPEG